MVCSFLINSSLISQSLLNSPESVVYDTSQNRYLVSNANEAEAGIVEIDSLGGQSFFAQGIGRVRGLHIIGNTVWAASDSGVAGFDLQTASRISLITIIGALFLNDITSDNDGNLYVSDTDRNRIYKIYTSAQTYTDFVISGIQSPNGLLYDSGNNRLLLCSFRNNSPIQAVQLSDSSVTTVKTTNLRNLDGLAGDHDGNYYVSAWGTGSVYRFDNQFVNAPVIISSGHSGPADIYFNPNHSQLVVPNFNANSLTFITINPVTIEDRPYADGFQLKPNYPNPFNPATVIRYQLAVNSKVTLKVYNLLGQEVRTLVNLHKSAGSHSVMWDGKNNQGQSVSSGVYLYRLEAGDFVRTRKMIMMK